MAETCTIVGYCVIDELNYNASVKITYSNPRRVETFWSERGRDKSSIYDITADKAREAVTKLRSEGWKQTDHQQQKQRGRWQGLERNTYHLEKE